MHTHLARVIYWLQQGDFRLLTCHSIYANIYPFDAQLNLLWTILFDNSDKFVGFVQYFAAIITGIGIFGIGRTLGGVKKFSLLASLFWLTFPLVIFQATSTQFDLVTSALLIASIYLLFEYLTSKKNRDLFFSALAMGLALGTKQTVFMFGAGFLLIGFILVIKDKYSIKWIGKWVLQTGICFLLFGSFMYFSNLYHFGNPLGPSEHVRMDSFGNSSFGLKIRYNIPRFLYQSISFDSLPTELGYDGVRLKKGLFQKLEKSIHMNLESQNALKDPNKLFLYDTSPSYNEDTAWFGFSSFLLFTLAIVIAVYRIVRKKELLPLFLIILALSFLFFEILLRPGWDPYQGRYFSLYFAILTPLIVLLPPRQIWVKVYFVIVSCVAIIQLFFGVVSNELKTLLGQKIYEYKYTEMENSYIPTNAIQSYYRKYSLEYYDFFWKNLPFYTSMRDYDEITLRTYGFRSDAESITREVNILVPDDAVMGVILMNGDYDYPFFGPLLKRILININPIELLYNRDWIQDKGIEYILVTNKVELTTIPENLLHINTVDGWSIYSVLR